MIVKSPIVRRSASAAFRSRESRLTGSRIENLMSRFSEPLVTRGSSSTYARPWSAPSTHCVASCRLSGSTPRNENNRQKALEMEHAHIERVHTLGRQASTEDLNNQHLDLFAALPVESDAPAVPT